MNFPHVLQLHAPYKHDTWKEGTKLGLLMGTATWIWVAIVDLVAGQPMHTFSALGGTAVFTLVHYALNVLYGVILLSAIHGAERTPSNIIAVLVGVVTLESMFAMLTNLLVNLGLGATGWIGVFGGSLVGIAVAMALLSRTHPLAGYLRAAEDEV